MTDLNNSHKEMAKWLESKYWQIKLKKAELSDLERLRIENSELREKICSLIQDKRTLYKANRWLTWTAIVILIMFGISLVVYTLK